MPVPGATHTDTPRPSSLHQRSRFDQRPWSNRPETPIFEKQNEPSDNNLVNSDHPHTNDSMSGVHLQHTNTPTFAENDDDLKYEPILKVPYNTGCNGTPDEKPLDVQTLMTKLEEISVDQSNKEKEIAWSLQGEKEVDSGVLLEDTEWPPLKKEIMQDTNKDTSLGNIDSKKSDSQNQNFQSQDEVVRSSSDTDLYNYNHQKGFSSNWGTTQSEMNYNDFPFTNTFAGQVHHNKDFYSQSDSQLNRREFQNPSENAAAMHQAWSNQHNFNNYYFRNQSSNQSHELQGRFVVSKDQDSRSHYPFNNTTNQFQSSGHLSNSFHSQGSYFSRPSEVASSHQESRNEAIHCANIYPTFLHRNKDNVDNTGTSDQTDSSKEPPEDVLERLQRQLEEKQKEVQLQQRMQRNSKHRHDPFKRAFAERPYKTPGRLNTAGGQINSWQPATNESQFKGGLSFGMNSLPNNSKFPDTPRFNGGGLGLMGHNSIWTNHQNKVDAANSPNNQYPIGPRFQSNLGNKQDGTSVKPFTGNNDSHSHPIQQYGNKQMSNFIPSNAKYCQRSWHPGHGTSTNHHTGTNSNIPDNNRSKQWTAPNVGPSQEVIKEDSGKGEMTGNDMGSSKQNDNDEKNKSDKSHSGNTLSDITNKYDHFPKTQDQDVFSNMKHFSSDNPDQHRNENSMDKVPLKNDHHAKKSMHQMSDTSKGIMSTNEQWKSQGNTSQFHAPYNPNSNHRYEFRPNQPFKPMLQKGWEADVGRSKRIGSNSGSYYSGRSNYFTCSTCSVCRQNFNWPHVLNCFHSFCFRCLVKVYDENKKGIACPSCSWLTPLGKKGLFEINIDVNLCSEISHSSNPFLCTVCNCTGEVPARCLDCMHFLCDQCQRKHSTTASTASHVMESVEILKWMNGTLTEMCSVHSKTALDRFCLDCQVAMCFLCIRNARGHTPNHNVVRDTERSKKNIHLINNEVTRMRDDVRKQIQPMILKKQDIESKARTCKNSIHLFSNNIIEDVSKNRTEARFLLDEVYDEVNKGISHLENLTSEFTKEYSALKDFTNRYLKDANPSTLMPVAKMIKQRFQILFNKYEQIEELEGFLGVDLIFSPEFPAVNDILTQSYLIDTTESLSDIINQDNDMGRLLRLNMEEVSLKTGSDINTKIKDELTDRDNNKCFPIPAEEETRNGDICEMQDDFDITRKATAHIYSFGNSGCGEYAFSEPSGLAYLSNGYLAVCDSTNHRVVIYNEKFKYERTIGQPPTADGSKNDRHGQRIPGCLYFPYRIAQCPMTQNLVIIERPPSRAVQIFETEGKFVSRFGNDVLQHPRGVAVDSNGVIVIIEGKTMKLMLFSQKGELLRTFHLCIHLEFPNDIAVKNGSIYISDNRGHCVHVFDYNGQLSSTIGNESVTYYPIGVSINFMDKIVVTDNHNTFNISVFDPNGTFQYGYKSCVKHANCFNVALHPSLHQLAVTSRDNLVIIFDYTPPVTPET